MVDQARRRTWKEDKDMKQTLKRDRQLFDKSSPMTIEEKVAPVRFGRRKKRLSIDQLKLVTRCGNCGEK